MKKRFFQIHLLTAAVGMLAASVFLWLNLSAFSRPMVLWVQKFEKKDTKLIGTRYSVIGWPKLIAEEYPGLLEDFEGVFAINPEGAGENPKTVPWTQLNDVPIAFSSGDLNCATLEKVEQFAPIVVENIDWMTQKNTRLPSRYWWWDWNAIAVNAAVAIAATLALMFTIEWFLRRRERRKV